MSLKLFLTIRGSSIIWAKSTFNIEWATIIRIYIFLTYKNLNMIFAYLSTTLLDSFPENILVWWISPILVVTANHVSLFVTPINFTGLSGTKWLKCIFTNSVGSIVVSHALNGNKFRGCLLLLLHFLFIVIWLTKTSERILSRSGS